MRFIVTGMRYTDAVKLMRDLRAGGIDCGEIAGGIGIYPTDAQVHAMAGICNRHGKVPEGGRLTLHEENVLFPDSHSRDQE